ncbi:MAG: 2-hydroxyacid dehydrogenase [Sediminibacterium magnilacihabitans]|jgi:D-lactate dehydrogenase|nr:2-hydroxyacid dehydrogenase [Sediminibacterium magnilacihabitans]PQV60309.1 D-lactate dehydrogenase [Sediminibacterium magnilacihabitans]
MRTLFYSTKDFEQSYLLKANLLHNDISFTETPLSLKTADEADGYDTVSVFTADDGSADVLKRLHQNGVKFIAIRAAGHDNIDLKKATELGIRVANVPDYSPYAIAEHTVALMLSLNRRIILSDRQVHLHNFTISDLIGFDLHNKTIGVIGVGKIGGVLIKILHGFGCHLLAHDILENEKLKLQYGFEYVSLQRLCSESNIISIHTCLTPQTKYLINKKFIDLMQRGVMLINTCRGGCVNTADVIAGLESGQIGYYGADVYENERGLFFNDLSGKNLEDPLLKKLLDMPNVLITPHQAFATNEALANIAATTFYNIDCWKKGKINKHELRLKAI